MLLLLYVRGGSCAKQLTRKTQEEKNRVAPREHEEATFFFLKLLVYAYLDAYVLARTSDVKPLQYFIFQCVVDATTGSLRTPLTAHNMRSSARAAAPLPLVGNRGRALRGKDACCWGARGGEIVHGPAKAGWGRRGGARRREGKEWSLETTTEPASTAASSMGARNLTTPAAQVSVGGSIWTSRGRVECFGLPLRDGCS